MKRIPLVLCMIVIGMCEIAYADRVSELQTQVRLLEKENAALRQELDRIKGNTGRVQSSIPIGSETSYTVPVTYAPLPPITDLEREFSGKDSVSVIFDGRPFEMHPSCAAVDQTPGKREMLVKHFRREIWSEEAITEMDAKGYRPATPLEARDFAKANPELQRKFWIVALGAFALHDGYRCVAVLLGGAGRRIFDVDWFDLRWNAENRFLFVRK